MCHADEVDAMSRKQVMNEFGHHEKGGEKHPSTTFLVHPKASQDLKDFAILHSQNMESMYYETLAQDGCFQAIGLYQYFFDKCHPNQQFSIQITNEVRHGEMLCFCVSNKTNIAIRAIV